MIDRQLEIFYQPAPFYNTTGEEREVLKKSRLQAGRQRGIILKFFVERPGEWTPWEVQGALGLHNTPITSIRRAITDLTTEGLLEKCATQKIGRYGKANHCWRLTA